VIGKIAMQDAQCIKCSESMKLYARSDVLRCDNCGSFYEQVGQQPGDQHIEFTYDFKNYRCTHTTYMDKCENECPAPYMYCLEHLKEENFNEAKRIIVSAEERVEHSKEILSRMEEAKKTWLIKEVSGIDDQDHTISED